jgi:hypothetical protein
MAHKKIPLSEDDCLIEISSLREAERGWEQNAELA